MTAMTMSKMQSTQLRTLVDSLVSSPHPDLSLRQLAVLLATVHEDAPQTIRGMAEKLKVAKPAITRAVDRLEAFELVQRKVDTADRRSVLISPRPAGKALVQWIDAIPHDADAGNLTSA